jgi:hypothetical protein
MGVRGPEDGERRILDLAGHDAYDVLEVGPAASDGQVLAAYRRAIARAHPDTGGSAEQAKLVNCAYDVLTRHRDAYDRYRSDLDARLTTGLTADPRSARAESVAQEHLRVARVGPDGKVRFAWAGSTDPGPDGARLTTDDDPADADPPVDPVDDAVEDTGFRADTRFRAGAPPRAHPLFGAGVRSGAGTARTPRTARRPLPRVAAGALAATAAVAALAVIALIGVWWQGGAGELAATPSGVRAWTTSELSASALPTVPPPAPSPTTPGVASTAGSAAAAGPAPQSAAHRCEVRADGSLWCSGSNAHGELGDGTTTDSAQPVRAGEPGVRWSAVVVGPSGTCGLQADGGLWCWGDNGFGQLGDGSFAAHPVPAQVAPGTGWLAIALDTHACGVRSDHTLWCWGANGLGELGEGRGPDRPLPQRLGSEATWAAVTVAEGISCGIRQNGTRQCWGA